MYNEILTIGSITIHGYGLMIGLGVMAALLLGDYRSKKFGLIGDHIYGMTFSAVILGRIQVELPCILVKIKRYYCLFPIKMGVRKGCRPFDCSRFHLYQSRRKQARNICLL